MHVIVIHRNALFAAQVVYGEDTDATKTRFMCGTPVHSMEQALENLLEVTMSAMSGYLDRCVSFPVMEEKKAVAGGSYYYQDDR